ncbi:DUF3078 domain-containing protein [Bacteroidota bacterium]
MKKFALLILMISLSGTFAQEADSTLYKWTPSLVAGLNISQIAFSNWTKGGDNAITWTLKGDYRLFYKTDTWKIDNEIKAAYGRTKLGSGSYKTNDNEFYFESVLSHNAGWKVDPYFSVTVRTAISKGYDYEKDPEIEIADLFDPGYITQGFGFTYDKTEGFKTRLGLAFQEVFTNKYTQYSDDSTTTDIEKFKFETGVEGVTDAEFSVAENIMLKTKLRLFTRLESLNVIDVRWDNMVTAKVNNWLNVNFTFLLIYEEAQSKQAQIKEAIQLGIVYTIF